MIQTIITHQCPRCGSDQMVKNGHDYQGAQKYPCKRGGSSGTLQAQRGYDATFRLQVRRALLERVSLRGMARIFAVSRRPLHRGLLTWITALPDLGTRLLPARVDDLLELDEVWSFVGRKEQERGLWVALGRRTRQGVAGWVGDRSETRALQLWRQLPNEYGHCASFSDRWSAYTDIFDTRRHRMVDQASGQTAHVERFFNTVRQRLARFVRTTLSFSKRDHFHIGVLLLFLYDYNRSCIS